MPMPPQVSHPRGYLPPYLVTRLLNVGDPKLIKSMYATGRAEAAAVARRTAQPAMLEGRPLYGSARKERLVYDMERSEAPRPGRIVRGETDQVATGDGCVDSVFGHAGITYDFYRDVLARRSLDGHGCPLISCVHYGQSVIGAFWDGSQTVYGDGDGAYFLSFARSLEIVAHEFSHGVMSFTANLAYDGQSGALNESFCDVMASIIVQWSEKQPVDAASWIMGCDVIGPQLSVPGVRSFLPIPLYQGDPLLGDDLQPKHIDGFVHTTEDYGGVHINSGIPNHAYYRAAQALGGKAWEKVGKIWFEGFQALSAQANFVDAAEQTILAAQRLFPEAESAVRDAWAGVGIKAAL